MLSEVFAPENWFLIFLGILWMIIAVIQDFRSREVANWWNFSLIVAAISYRAFLSIYSLNYWYVLWGVIGLAGGMLIGNLFYYARMFAGGDAKLMYGVGVVLPLGLTWQTNLSLLIWFLGLFLVVGGVYGLSYSIVLSIINKKRFSKEFIKQIKKNKAVVSSVMFISFFVFILGLIIRFNLLGWMALLFLIAPLLLIYAKAIEESCMVREVAVSRLTIGDWLAQDIKIGKRYIRQNWEGLSEKELKKLQKNYKGKILIKQGIPFTPSFLIAFILLLMVFAFNLNSWIILF